MKIPTKIKQVVKEYSKENKFSLKSLSEEVEGKKSGAYLVQLKNKKIKAIIFDDERELNNFLNLCPKIENTPKILYKKENIILTEWLEGEVREGADLTIKDIKGIAQFQANMHLIPIRYDKEEVIERFKKKIKTNLRILEETSALSAEELKKIRAKLEKEFPKNPRISIVHSD